MIAKGEASCRERNEPLGGGGREISGLPNQFYLELQMAKEGLTNVAPPAAQRQPNPNEAVTSEPEGLLAGALSNWQMAGGEPVDAQLGMLRRVGSAQRQAMLTQIGRRQGNAHVQRLIDALSQTQARRPATQEKVTAGPKATVTAAG